VGDPRSLNALTLAAAPASLNDAPFAAATARARRPGTRALERGAGRGCEDRPGVPPARSLGPYLHRPPDENALARAALKKIFA